MLKSGKKIKEAVYERGPWMAASAIMFLYCFYLVKYGRNDKSPDYAQDGVCDYCSDRATEQWVTTTTINFQRLTPYFKTEACERHNRLKIGFSILLPKYVTYGLVGMFVSLCVFIHSLFSMLAEAFQQDKEHAT